MPWTERYWDAVSEFYWVPSYLGLKSIPRRQWKSHGDNVLIPRELTNPDGPLYRRTINSKDYPNFIRRQEETFNHIFNLAISLIPGEVVSSFLGEFIGITKPSDYRLVGSSHCLNYPWISGANVTSPDSFLISNSSVLAIEIKFNAKTSLDQLAKYVALISGEVLYGGAKDHLSLLYIYPKDAETNFLKETSLSPNDVNETILPVLEESCKNKNVRKFFNEESFIILEVLSSLKVSCITWSMFLEKLREYSASLGNSCGDRTLKRVLEGLALEIERHPLARIQ